MTRSGGFNATLTWLPAFVALTVGVLLHDCVLLASSAVLAMKGFHDRMDRDAPQRPLSAVLRCLRAGLASALLSIALVAMLAAGFLDWWQPANDQPVLVGGLLVLLLAASKVASVAISAVEISAAETALLVVAAAALLSTALGYPLASCAFAATAALYLAWQGWLLMRHVASDLWQAAQ